MLVIQQHSSFINCVYPEHVTECLDICAAKKKIDSYYKFVKTFCEQRMKQYSYVTPFLTDQSRHLLSSETITFTLEWTPNEKTLTDV